MEVVDRVSISTICILSIAPKYKFNIFFHTLTVTKPMAKRCTSVAANDTANTGLRATSTVHKAKT